MRREGPIATIKLKRITRECTQGTEHTISLCLSLPGKENEYLGVTQIEDGNTLWTDEQREYEERRLWERMGDHLRAHYEGKCDCLSQAEEG